VLHVSRPFGVLSRVLEPQDLPVALRARRDIVLGGTH
jgi:hypothetical protein